MKIKIKEVVKSRNISLYKVAKLMNTQQQTVYSWANGRTQPCYANMEKLCIVLKCTLDDLFEIEI